MTTAADVLPTPLPPASFAQLNAARARAFAAGTAATHKAMATATQRHAMLAGAARMPILGIGSPVDGPHPVVSQPAAHSWLWFPAVLIAGAFLYTFFSKKTFERSARRRNAGARLFRARRQARQDTDAGKSPEERRGLT